MKRILVYSHDTYGLGNIRRMLAVVEHLVKRDPDICALILSGSPMMQAFRLSPRIDYIKLPCLTRSENGNYQSRFLDMEYKSIITLRADLILNTLLNFEPDLILVDKKPLGVQNELAPALDVIGRRANRPRVALVTREILDSPDVTRGIWERNDYHAAIAEHYDSVLVLGPKAVFDMAREYRFPESTVSKICYCGYIAKRPQLRSAAAIRDELGAGDKPIVVLTAGGGRDGYRLFDTGLRALLPQCRNDDLHVVVVHGPEIDESARAELRQLVSGEKNVTAIDFTNDMMSYLSAATMAISMAGYNTVTELLSLGVSAVLVPRAKPSQEQWMRATRLERLGLFTVIHPDQFSVETLRTSVDRVFKETENGRVRRQIDMAALDVVHNCVQELLREHDTGGWKKLQLRNVAETQSAESQLADVLALPLSKPSQ